MKHFLHTLSALSLTAAIAMPAVADVAKPTLREGDFYCFRGMPQSEINYLPAAPASNRPVFRIDKLGNSKFDNTDGHDLREITVEGEFPVLVILVEFADVRFITRWGDPHATVNDMLNSPNYTFQGATGSVNDYYQRVSAGKFNPKFDVVGPVRLSKNEVEYVTSNPDDTYIDPATGKSITCYPAGRMVEEAVKSIEDQIDFTKYDTDGDGLVDFVYLFFAGQGATTGGASTRTIWPHAFTLNSAIGAPVDVGGVKVNRYCTSSELGVDTRLSGIGTFCHEFGHVLGLPDLYDTANNNGQVSKCFSPGSFDNMDAGNYNNSEHTPPFFSTYEQYSMEWMKPASLSGTGIYTLLPLEARQFGYQVMSPKNPQEYFILEARGKSFLDQHMKGHGLLVWHIDFHLPIWTGNTVNNNPSHQRIDIIEADNKFDDATRSGDPFPGNDGICEFTKSISPTFKDWDGNAMGYDLREINVGFDGTVTFKATGSEDIAPEAVLDAPAPKVISADANSINVEWPAVNNAEGYYISVFDASKFDGSSLSFSDFYPGWYYRNVGEILPRDGICSYQISDLPANVACGIMVYAVNSLNASKMKLPIFASTVDGNDFEAASTNLVLTSADDAVRADWDAVENADEYELLIVTREMSNAVKTFEHDFANKKLPDNWKSGSTSYDTRKFGVESPSLSFMLPGAFLQSPIYDEPISSLSFWACKRYKDEQCELNVFSLDKNGIPTLAYSLTDLSKDGSEISLEMPANTYGVRLSYDFSVTDLNLYLDDLKVEFNEGHTDTPVADAEISYSDNVASVKGLKEGQDYVAYVYPVKDSERGAKSNEFAFRVENLAPSAVDTILGEESSALKFTVVGKQIIPNDYAATYDVFTVDGAAVALDTAGITTLPAKGIYIIRTAKSAIKVII